MPRIEVAGDICLRRAKPAQGCRADDNDDDEDDDDDDDDRPAINLLSTCDASQSAVCIKNGN